MTPEHNLGQSIRIWCGERGYLAWHCNVGTFLTTDGRYVPSGLPRGFSDLLILTPHGACFVETKIHPRKPTQAQLDFIQAVRKLGYRAGVAYTLDEAIAIIENA